MQVKHAAGRAYRSATHTTAQKRTAHERPKITAAYRDHTTQTLHHQTTYLLVQNKKHETTTHRKKRAEREGEGAIGHPRKRLKNEKIFLGKISSYSPSTLVGVVVVGAVEVVQQGVTADVRGVHPMFFLFFSRTTVEKNNNGRNNIKPQTGSPQQTAMNEGVVLKALQLPGAASKRLFRLTAHQSRPHHMRFGECRVQSAMCGLLCR